MQDLLQDFRFAVRTLVKTPGFAAVAIITLALGIGANSAIFSVVNGVVLRPLPYASSERLVFLTSAFPSLGFDEFWMSQPEYLEYGQWNESLDDIGAYNTFEMSITGGEVPLRVSGATVTRGLFTTLGVEPARGRIFNDEEDSAGADPVALLSSELWQRAFGAREDIVGSSIDIDGVTTTVVGVMPPGFDINDQHVEIWAPMAIDTADPRPRSNHFLYAVGRLGDGAAIESARAELATMLASWRERIPDGHVPNPDTHSLQLEPLQDEVVGEIRPALLLLLGAVGFVLLIACANVGNLLLARAESRQREIAIHTALGAGRGRLVRQFLTESVLLSLVGGAAGMLLGHWGLRALLATSPESIPRVNEIALDGSVALFTLGVSLVTGLLFGLAPLLHVTVRNLGRALHEGGQRSTSGSARMRLRRLLVAGEIALAVVLVVGAGLMLRSFSSLQSVDPGFDPEGLLTFRIFLPSSDYPDGNAQAGFFTELVDRLEAIPGVVDATMMSGLPPQRRVNANDMEFEGIERTEDGPPHNVDFWQFVTDGYFDTMNIPIVEGRAFGPEDVGPGAQPSALINQTLADVFYPGESPLGRRLRPPDPDIPWLSVVGVVGDVKQDGLDADTGTETYFYVPQTAAIGFVPQTMNVGVRTSVAPTSVSSAVRDTVWSLDPGLPLADLQTMGDVLFRSVARPRFLTLLLGIFGAVALALAAIGTYGVMSYSVAERTHELGIRRALGAESGGLLRLVLVQGMSVALVGLAVGIAASFWLMRFMRSILFGVGATDVVTFVSVPLILAVVAAIACLLPARRATRVDPMVALRSE